MKKSDIGTLIKKSFDRTRRMLFEPFLLKKWLFLTLIALLAGAIGFGGSGGGGGSNHQEKKAEAAVVQPPSMDTPTNTAVSLPASPGVVFSPATAHKAPFNFPDWRHWPSWVFALIGLGVILLFGIMIAYSWLWSRFQFVWFNAIVQNDASVAKPFEQYAYPGQSLFNFSLVTLVVFWALFAGFAFWIYRVIAGLQFFQDKTIPWFVYFQSFAGPAAVFILFMVVTGIFWAYVQHFVVTIMALENCRFIDGWKKFSELYRSNTKDLIVYLFVALGLGALSAVIQMILGFIWMLAIMIVGGIIFGGAYLVLVVLLKMKVFFTIVSIVFGIPAFLVVMVASNMLALPFAVFFRNFSLYYMSALEGPYKPLALEETKE